MKQTNYTRKKIFLYTAPPAAFLLLLEPVIMLAQYLISYETPDPIFTDGIHATLWGLILGTSAVYAHARTSQGSPEYTPEEYRDYYPTRNTGEQNGRL